MGRVCDPHQLFRDNIRFLETPHAPTCALRGGNNDPACAALFLFEDILLRSLAHLAVFSVFTHIRTVFRDALFLTDALPGAYAQAGRLAGYLTRVLRPRSALEPAASPARGSQNARRRLVRRSSTLIQQDYSPEATARNVKGARLTAVNRYFQHTTQEPSYLIVGVVFTPRPSSTSEKARFWSAFFNDVKRRPLIAPLVMPIKRWLVVPKIVRRAAPLPFFA